MASKFLDDSGLAYLWLKIKTLVGGKVDKVDGKGLSTNDYTSDEKTKLANIATGAQVNVLEGIQKNGTNVTITNKIANITVPTKTSDITNDSGFITAEDVPEGAAASSTTPKMNGTAAVGTETAFARGDHVHPTDTSRVPTTRTVNGKALSADITLSASDVGALPDDTAIPVATSTSPKMNGTAAVGTETKWAKGDHVHPSDTSRVPITRKVNGKALSADITLSASDVGALPDDTAIPAATSTSPKMNGTAAVGTETKWAKGDHVHPTDTSRAPVASPTFTGTPKAPTAAAGTNTTQIATTEFVKTAVDTAIAGVTQFSYEVVTSLPTTGVVGKIYLVAHSHGTGDAYDEYIWTGSSFEKIGNTDIDLSGYMLVTDMVAMTNTEIDTACE